MIARIASLLGLGGVAAQPGSANGPSTCPLCCRGRAAAQATDLPSEERRRWIAERQGEGASSPHAPAFAPGSEGDRR
jgi:hypothetical protein